MGSPKKDKKQFAITSFKTLLLKFISSIVLTTLKNVDVANNNFEDKYTPRNEKWVLLLKDKYTPRNEKWILLLKGKLLNSLKDFWKQTKLYLQLSRSKFILFNLQELFTVTHFLEKIFR